MISDFIIEKLRSIYSEMDKISLPGKGDGWVSQHDFQSEVRNARISFKNMGYEWFNEFLEATGMFYIWTDFSGEKPIRYVIEKKAPQTHNERRPQQHNSRAVVEAEYVRKLKQRLRLTNDQFIGQFIPQQSDGWYKIVDIRNTDFTKIEDKERGIKDLFINFKCVNREFTKSAYYKFTWVLLDTEPLKFGIDLKSDVVEMSPEGIVKCLYDGIMRYPAGAAQKISRSLDTLRKQLTQSGKEVFIYELLQNANDYPRVKNNGDEVLKLPVEVEFHITKDYLVFEHTGRYFNPRNIAAICDINAQEKSDKEDAIGYKGIGFKTVFLDNDYVLLNTGDYSFRFDKDATDVIDTPWQILPVWTDLNEIDEDLNRVLGQTPNYKFQVKFALQPRDKSILTDISREDNYINLFSQVFESERVILFIPNIKKVTIFVDGYEPIVREQDNNDWCVSGALENSIPNEITKKINYVLANPDSLRSDGYEKIPEKYLNFHKTSVKFACKKVGRKLKPVDDAILYCYLPAKRADWGFKFLMNTDMVPNGQRDDIEDIELNHVIARIAGRQFYYWIKQLIASREYDLDSIFSLIPDFEECKRHRIYKDFITEFQEEFEELIKNEPFVPCINESGEKVEATIDDIINDQTRISAKGFMGDSIFIALSNTGCDHLPVMELRSSKAFQTFLFRHSPSEYDFNFDNLIDVVSNDDFKEWLEDEENDTNFISHLVDEDKLADFTDEKIFIEAGETLFCSGDMYVDFDSEMSRLDFLRDYIPYLSPSLRTKLAKHGKWADYEASYFKEFDAEDMLKEFVLNDQDALDLLDDEDNSVNFFKFAAEKNIDMSVIEDISFIDEDGELQSEYSKTYFYSDDVYTFQNEQWLPEDSLHILSHAYFDEPALNDSLKEEFEEAGVRSFDHIEFIREKLIADNDFASDVNELITDDFEKNLSFVLYTFAHKEALKDKESQLKDFVLLCVDKDGDGVYLNKDDVRYFAHFVEPDNSSYNENISFDWISHKMMYALDEDYIRSVATDQQKSLESFLRQSFGVKTFTDKSFWTDVVSANEDEIYELIETKEDALSFLSYMVRDRRLLFGGSISFKDLQNIPLLRADGTISNDRDYPLYTYGEVAADMENRPWYTQEFYLLDQVYTEQLSSKELQLLQIDSFNIQSVLDSLCDDKYFNPSDKDENVDFWRWIKNHAKDISDYSKLQTINVYIDGINSLEFSELYIPDAFFPAGEGIENLVKKFNEEATFVPEWLIEEQTEKCKAEWVRLLKKLNAKFDNKAILEHVLDNLGDYEDDSVLALLTQHKKDLFDNWDKNLPSLRQLLVRTRGGEYLSLDECIIVNKEDGDDEAEPFKYIVLNSEVAPELQSTNSEIIYRIAESFSRNNVLAGRREWANYKIEEYINRIQDDENERTRLHSQFIKDLAKWGDSFELDRDQILKILFRTKGSGRFLEAKELTLGSLYKPACNFEKYHVNLDYLSDTYLTEDNKDLICTFFRENTDIHHRFEREDIKYMSNREFAIYIWTVIFKKVTSIGKWIQEGAFNGVECIPTAQSVKCPEDIYSPYLLEYIRLCNNYTDKIPAIDIDKLEDGMISFMKLPFKTKLNSKDCLTFLLNAQEKNEDDTKHRRQIIDWLLENDDLSSQDIETYRSNPEAKWKNGRDRYVHISSLYAIHPSSTQERLVFSTDENIIRTKCFPDDEDKFEDICDMLDIRILKSEDFKTIPVAPVRPETAEILDRLKVRLLILAAIDHDDKYAKYYKKYLEEVTKYGYYSCARIELAYGDIHGSVVGRTYIDDADSKIYYVSAWDNRRTYTKFCHTIKIVAGVRANDDICEEVFDESMTLNALIDKYCYSLRSDKVFLKYMEDLKQQVLAVEEEVREANVEEMKYAYESEEETPETPPRVEIPKNEEVISESQNEFVDNTEEIEDEPDSEDNYEEPYAESEPKEQDRKSKTIHEAPLVAGPGEEALNEHSHPEASSRTQKQESEEHTCKSKEPRNSNWKREPHNYSKKELDNMRSYGSPIELTTLPPTNEEIEVLSKCGISPEKIADSNYVAQLRMYRNLQEKGQQLEESLEEFIQNSGDVTEHQLVGGKYIHSCSAAHGVMYVSPSIWNKVMDGQCAICVYYGAHANQFYYIDTPEKLLELVEKDDVVIKITGKEKVNVVGALYNGLLKNVKGTAYTLIRVAAHTEMDAVFARYIGGMREKNDGNDIENEDEY